jgi:hypothetical protein
MAFDLRLLAAIRLFLALVVAIGHLQTILLGPAALGVPGYIRSV